ncbi:ABC transporter permease [Roseovarius nanhaiticus]|uniref:Spermidine/putrescine transport system permease protein n=1 Tax=Roseovarius nanhaiticus TaxID=573024 RepID=A0A1N7FA39_9RHOB|nr:ABC transporter permease [Roseovarius nanhaiticus]SEK58764.1 spermidine/putrescine transport system permease protein [Roseovarius nanhaiticus]SIR97189.1 spermidine/putrescine transport system permease protein [Roseovarius nanhaiticus]
MRGLSRYASARWLAVYATCYMIFLYAPVILLPLFAFNDATIIAFPLAGYTTRWFDLLWETDALHSAVRNSAIVALSTALISTLLGACAARSAAKYTFPAQKGIMGFIMLPLVLPEIIVAVALLVMLMQLGMSLSLWTVIAGHVLICTPFSIAILSSAFAGMEESLEEASFDLGETRWGTFRRVTLPLIMPGIVSSLLITFTISLDEFIIAFFLTGTDVTLPVYIWSQLRFPSKLPSIMALGTILLAVSIGLLVVAEFFRRRAVRRRGMDSSSTEGLI